VFGKRYDDNVNNNVGADLVSARIELTDIGKIIEKVCLNLEKEFTNIKLHDYIIMPNHIHCIIEIYKRADTRPASTIGNIISAFKSKTTTNAIKEIKNGKIKSFNKKIWQRNYYEHIIRNETEYLMIKQYITNNPYNWENDKYY